MKRINNPFLIFQLLFFGISTFLVHAAIFDFWHLESDMFWRVFANWFPLLIIDFIGGLVIGLLICGGAYIFAADDKSLLKPLILTDILWLALCVWWSFVFRDRDGRDPAIHVISPILIGGIGFFFALANLLYSAIFTRKRSSLA